MPTWRNRQTHQVESLAVDKTVRDRGPPSVPAPRASTKSRQSGPARRRLSPNLSHPTLRSWRNRQTQRSQTPPPRRRPGSWPGARTSFNAQLKGIRHTSLNQNQRLLRSNRRLGTIAGKLIQMSTRPISARQQVQILRRRPQDSGASSNGRGRCPTNSSRVFDSLSAKHRTVR